MCYAWNHALSIIRNWRKYFVFVNDPNLRRCLCNLPYILWNKYFFFFLRGWNKYIRFMIHILHIYLIQKKKKKNIYTYQKKEDIHILNNMRKKKVNKRKLSLFLRRKRKLVKTTRCMSLIVYICYKVKSYFSFIIQHIYIYI